MLHTLPPRSLTNDDHTLNLAAIEKMADAIQGKGQFFIAEIAEDGTFTRKPVVAVSREKAIETATRSAQMERADWLRKSADDAAEVLNQLLRRENAERLADECDEWALHCEHDCALHDKSPYGEERVAVLDLAIEIQDARS